MLNTEKQREVVASGLKKYLGCGVIRTNQTMQMPDFPYLGYNITTLATENKGTYGEYVDGKARKPVLQVYSFTARSNDYAEAVEIANNARTWLDYVGTQYLNDNEVIVQSVGSVADRSNLLTTDYVYSFGFDCWFWMYDVVDLPDNGTIERMEFGEDWNKRLENRLDGVPGVLHYTAQNQEDEELAKLLETRLTGE